MEEEEEEEGTRLGKYAVCQWAPAPVTGSESVLGQHLVISHDRSRWSPTLGTLTKIQTYRL